ncbi:transposase [Saccharopolyspora sp. NPDC050389]|uniref:transposase n=1 Tax=Saccharopolyspora sp. NPDC050389 TaxID=3155516 RepID=UPI0034114B1C
MSRPPVLPAEDKIRIVLSVLSGEKTIAEVARWKAQFLEGGRAGIAEGGTAGPSSREEQLQTQIEELTTALGEAHVELRVWKKSAERLAPSRTSR